MVRQQRDSTVHEDRYPSRETSQHRRGKDELVKRDMLDPPSYLRRRRTEDIRGKALSFGVLDWKQFERCKEDSTKGALCSYASSYTDSVEASASSLELDLATGVVKILELDSKPQSACLSFSPPYMRHDSFSLRSQEYSPLRRKQKECLHRRHDDVQGECSSSVNVMERNQNSLLDQKVPTVTTSKKERHASPNRRFSFSFSQMSRSFSSKESSSSVPAFSSTSNASAKSGPLTFTDSVYTNHSTRTKPITRSGPLTIPKSQMATRPPTMEKSQCSSRSHAILQFTLRKGISLYQFVVDNNNSSNNVLAATMKSSDSSTRSYTLYTIKQVKNKSGNWLGRHKNDHPPFVQTVIGQMKTKSDSATHKSESVLFGAETKEEVAAIVQTRNRVQKQSTTSVILPSGAHTLPKDCNTPLPLIKRWESGGSCDCGGWDIGCKLRVLSNDHRTKSQTVSSFQLFDQERDEPAFKMVTHDNELHSVEFGSSMTLMEAFFISLAVSSHQNWCEEEEEAVLMGDGLLKRQTSTKYASNPPVSPIGRV